MSALDELHRALTQGISNIAGIRQCAPFPRRMDRVELPAVFLDLVELEPGTDPGTGELALITHWEARIVVAELQSDALKIHYSLAVAIMQWLRSHDFPQVNVGKAELKQAAPDHFAPEMQGHDVWLVEWTHQVRLGDSIWDGTGIMPDQVSIGFKEDYAEITIDGDGIRDR
jgi:hypothetical protein